MALTDGLVGLWSPFMGASGYRLLDRSGRGNHGTLTNMDAGTDWVGATVNGRSGYALDFDGSNDHVEVPHNSAYNTTKAISIDCWFKTTQGVDGYIATKNEDSFYLCIGPSGTEINKMSFYLSGVTANWIQSANFVNTGKWSHVNASWDGAFMRIYINGRLEASAARTGTMTTGTSPIKIGARTQSSPGYLNGSITSFAVYNRALSFFEVEQNYSLGPGIYLALSRKVYGFVPAAGGVTGDLSATLGSLTLSSSSDLADGASGSLSASLDSATLSSSATLADGLSASLAATLGNATLSSSADVVDGGSGSLSSTLGNASVSSDATLNDGLSASLSATLGNASVSSSAILEDGLTASLSKTLNDATLSASGAESVGLAGDLSATLDAATLSSSATLADGLSGSLSASLSDATLSSSATLADGATGSVSATLDSCTVSSSGSFGAGLTAELNAALDSATVSSSGTLANGLTANLSVQLASATLAASGVIGTPSTNSNFKINVGGTWKEATPFVNVGGVWKQATPFIKVNGEWK